MALIRGFIAQLDDDETIVWLMYASLQHLSLVAYETDQFFSRLDASDPASNSWAHRPTLAASRHSTKLFNDTKKTHADLLTEFAAAAAADRRWFSENNRAPELFREDSPLGWLINDTSVVQHNGRLLSTSHSINFHAKLNPTVTPEEAFGRAQELAAYLAALTDADETSDEENNGHVHAGPIDDTIAWEQKAITVKDARYEPLYRAMYPTVPVDTAIALAILRTDLTGLKLVRELTHRSSFAPATFKLRYIGLWQILETLGAMNGQQTSLDLPTSIRKDINTLLADPRIAPLRTTGARRLRNVLTHYGLGQTNPALLNWDDPLLGLPEVHMDGTNWVTLDQRLDQEIATVVNLLDSWAGPIEHVLEEPHE